MKNFFAILLFCFLPTLSLAQTAKILIVPGHDNDSKGAGHKKVLEVDINRTLADKITNILKLDSRFDVTDSHQGNDYSPEFLSYYEKDYEKINEWRKKVVAEFNKHIKKGKVTKVASVPHSAPPLLIINRLYGINKWVVDNKVDAVIHLHFNDYGSHPKQSAGKFTGFAVYAPEKQLVNSPISMPLAQFVFDKLDAFLYRADSGTEGPFSHAPIEDQSLIAVGSYGSLTKDNRSILLEYSYIYEPLVQKYFETASTIFADATTRAVKSHFFGDKFEKPFSYKWSKFLTKDDEGDDVLALQFALKNLGYFPPKNKERVDCPMTGYFGDCTKEAVKEFQKNNNLQTIGRVGPQTLSKLNSLFQ